MPEAPQWARVRGEMNCYIRRGAWYEVLRLTPEEVVLEVNRQPVRVERSALQIVPLRPQNWSVVARPRDSVDMRSEEHTSELQSLRHIVCRPLLAKEKTRDS